MPSVRTAFADFFATRKEVDLVYLFGSRTKGTHRAGSDLDVAVLLRRPLPALRRYRYAQRVADRLERVHADATGRRCTVDLVLLNHADPLLCHQVIKYGALLFERRSKGDRDFRVRTMTRYFDTKPLRDFFTRRALEQ